MPVLKRHEPVSLRKNQPLVVHLGNVGDLQGDRHAVKTRSHASRFSGIKFVGIDKRPVRRFGESENWTQIKADFREGLEQLPDGKANLITSDMALGYYGSEQYIVGVVATAHKKLKAGGKLKIRVEKKVVGDLVTTFLKAGFEDAKITVRELKEGEHNSPWLNFVRKRDKVPCYEIVAVK